MRHARINPDQIKVDPRWSRSELVFEAYGDAKKRVTVEIENPWMLKLIRRRLDEIENYWKGCLV